jgi:dTDP-glucose pyrophosphorylase
LENWSEIILKATDTINMAIKTLQKGGLRIALIVDDSGKLIGTITDGDIRRSLIKHIAIDSAVSEVMNHNPTTALETDTSEFIMLKMKERDLLHVPIVDINGVLVGLETLQHLVHDKHYENPVLIMAGGFGKRLMPLTENTPKPLLNLGNYSILETILMQFVDFGFKNFYISVHFEGEKIKNFFGNGSRWGVKISYLDESTPLGTAGAIGLLPKDLPKLPLLMINGDVLTRVNFEHLLAFHNENNDVATVCIREYEIQVPFGVINIKGNKVDRIDEKPIKKFFINAGVYVFDHSFIESISNIGSIDMPNLLEKQMNKGDSVGSFLIHEYWKDIGTMREYKNAKDAFPNGFNKDD